MESNTYSTWVCLNTRYYNIHWISYIYNILLVGGIPTPLTNIKVSWDDDIPNIWNIYIVTNQNHDIP
jgi:hypothetical protein